MKTTWKRIGFVILLLVVIGGVYSGYVIGRAWRAYHAEDEIAHTFYPVVQAIYQYAEAKGTLPRQLSDLVPEHLSAMPSSKRVKALAYRALPDGEWRLDVHTTERGVWSWRSSRDAPRKDNAMSVGYIHGWEIVQPTSQATDGDN